MVVQLRVLTLNCWGLKYVSKHREERLGCIGEELARGRYDVVTLQEVWVEKDYESICDKVKNVLPHHHYFHSGCIGSGLCILSKWPIVNTFMHRFALNSFAYHVFEGDWFAGKGVGLCELEVEDMTVNVYTLHNAALYAPSGITSADKLFTHRLLQNYEVSEFVRVAGASSDVNIVAGDFNTEDFSLGYEVALVNAGLKDAWKKCINQDTKDQPCNTVETEDNCYTHMQTKYYIDYSGMRIDFIFYGSNPGYNVTCQDRSLAMEKIPGTEMHYSDHKGVEVLFEMHKVKDECAPRKSLNNAEERLSILLQILPFIQSSIRDVKEQSFSYLLKSLIIFLFLIFIWMGGLFHWMTSWSSLGALGVFVAVVVLGITALCIGGFVKRTELNQLVGKKREITLQVSRLESLLRHS
ncbi:putative neutral sphingomyelinase [Asterias amurensis]|uniref:putative neutral sphingomyelinase n=1 Tax=Asterias amurensis TaxID=7602 RepID=UPI003AB78011